MRAQERRYYRRRPVQGEIMDGSVIFLIFTLLGGATAGWLIAYFRFGRQDSRVIELKSKLHSVESALDDAKQQVRDREKNIDALRDRMEIVQRDKAVAETRVDEISKKIEEQKLILDNAKSAMTETFQALSGESLKSNNRAFLELAKESLEIILRDAKGEVEKKEESIKNVVKPLEEALNRYERNIGEMEKTRATAYGNLENQIKSLIETQEMLKQETNNLVLALRRPEIRGRWGEVTLKRVAELAGMVDHCDYTEQVSIESEGGRLRPDMIVHLPAGREIVVDSKVSLDAYLDAMSADSPEKKEGFIIKHARQVRRHMKSLAGKSYWDQFEKAPEFVVMFIPGESFLSAAVENDPALIEDGMESKVIIATPTTLISLLRAIAYGWRQERVAKNAQEIARIGKELYDRFLPFIDHVNKTGGALTQAVVSFNKMIMSLERRVMVSVRRFKDLGASGDKELAESRQVEQIPMKTQGNE